MTAEQRLRQLADRVLGWRVEETGPALAEVFTHRLARLVIVAAS